MVLKNTSVSDSVLKCCLPKVSIIELQREHYFSDYALLSTLIDAATLFGLRESQQSKLGRKKEVKRNSNTCDFKLSIKYICHLF